MFASTNELEEHLIHQELMIKNISCRKNRNITSKKNNEAQRELDLDISQIPYEDRDHALYIAFGPYKNPRYALVF